MEDKFFPITTTPACPLKWSWSTIRLYSGTTSSCHRVKSDTINAENFDTFHNTPKKLADRKLMLEGKWPTGGCEYCKKIEDAGGTSDRMFHSTIPNTYPGELDEDQTLTVVNPKIVEVYFDNVCNLSCIYCWDGFSSKIRSENQRFGRFENNGVVIDNRANPVDDLPKLTAKFWEYMERNCKGIKRFHFLGGEPFYQKQFDYALEWFKEHPCPNLEFNIVSNLNIDHDKFRAYIADIKQLVDMQCLGRFDLTCSIDCMGPEQEYVRFGIDLNLFKRNFEHVVGEEWIYLTFNQTVTSLTLKTAPEAISYIKSFSDDTRHIGHHFGLVVGQNPLLHPEIFGTGFWEEDMNNILNVMPELTSQDKQVKLYMNGIRTQLSNTVRDQKKINQLAILLDEIDRRRNLNWREVFPWLTNEIRSI